MPEMLDPEIQRTGWGMGHPMSAPTDNALRKAVIEWTKAQLRMAKWLHTSWPPSQYSLLKTECIKANLKVTRLGVRLLAEKPAKRGKR
jgi:hypothetical protein